MLDPKNPKQKVYGRGQIALFSSLREIQTAHLLKGVELNFSTLNKIFAAQTEGGKVEAKERKNGPQT